MRKLTFSFLLFTVLYGFGLPGQAAEVACTNGKAVVGSGSSVVEYPCLRVNLLSRMTITDLGGTSENDSASDIWGWVDTDPDNDPGTTGEKHYAIVGLYCSTAFVDISDPEAPVLVATLPDATELDGTRECTEATSSPKPSGLQKHDEEKKEGAVWRDIKVINNHAFIVSDHADIINNEPGPGLQVFDLTQLRTPPADGQFDLADQDSYGTYNAHNVFTYTGSGGNDFAVVVGATEGDTGLGGSLCSGSGAGGPLFFDVTNPQSPTWAGRFCGDGYTHDIECVVYSGPDGDHQGSDICVASNEDSLTVIDATQKNNVQLLAKQQYSLVEYTHQGAFDQAQKFFYLNDEMDEKTYQIPTRTLVWDMTNLDAPKLVTEYLAPLSTIDHNNYVHGDYLFQSNYTSGFRVLDIHSRKAPYQKAFFDTFPDNDAVGFDGAWSNFRFPGGVVAISDISGGLFLVRPTYEAITDTADIDLALTASASRVEYQIPYTYTIDLVNDGPDPSGEVYVTLRLSSGGTFDSTSESDSDCEVISEQLMECRISSLISGDEESFTVKAAGFSDTQVTAVAMASPMSVDEKGTNNVVNKNVALTPIQDDSGGGSVGWLSLVVLLGFIALVRTP